MGEWDREAEEGGYIVDPIVPTWVTHSWIIPLSLALLASSPYE